MSNYTRHEDRKDMRSGQSQDYASRATYYSVDDGSDEARDKTAIDYPHRADCQWYSKSLNPQQGSSQDTRGRDYGQSYRPEHLFRRSSRERDPRGGFRSRQMTMGDYIGKASDSPRYREESTGSEYNPYGNQGNGVRKSPQGPAPGSKQGGYRPWEQQSRR